MQSATFGGKTFSYQFPSRVYGPRKMTCHLPWDRRLGEYAETPVVTTLMDQIAQEFVRSIQGFYERKWIWAGTKPGRSLTGNAIIVVNALEVVEKKDD